VAVISVPWYLERRRHKLVAPADEQPAIVPPVPPAPPSM
jgi:hypothetical protein